MSGDPGKAVDRSEVIEVYRVFRFGTDGEYYVCLVTNAWTDEQAWEHVKTKFKIK